MSAPTEITIAAPIPESEQPAAEATQQVEEMTTVKPIAPAARIVSAMAGTQDERSQGVAKSKPKAEQPTLGTLFIAGEKKDDSDVEESMPTDANFWQLQTTIKNRFASHPEIYHKFLEILHSYQKEQRGVKEVLDEVSLLFTDHADPLKEFAYFFPDAVQGQAKAQLDVALQQVYWARAWWKASSRGPTASCCDAEPVVEEKKAK